MQLGRSSIRDLPMDEGTISVNPLFDPITYTYSGKRAYFFFYSFTAPVHKLDNNARFHMG